MAVLHKHDRRTERHLRRYFEGKCHHWGRWLIFLLLATIVSLTVLELWRPNIVADAILNARSYAPLWFPLQELARAIDFINPYVQESWIWAKELVRIIPIPESVFQLFNIDKSQQSLFIVGIVFPVLITTAYLLVWILWIVTAAILGLLLILPKRKGPIIFGEIDKALDHLLANQVELLKRHSCQRLNLDLNELVLDEPLVIQAPVMWYRKGIKFNDLQWRIGKDGKSRFGVYRFLIMHLTDRHLCVYSSYYNVIEGVTLNESLDRHPYTQIVAVNLTEYNDNVKVYDDSIVVKLRSGKRATLRRQFRIDFTNGDKLTMTIDGPRLVEEEGIPNPQLLTGAEKAFRALTHILADRDRT